MSGCRKKWVRILMPVAAGVVIVGALAGCGRVSATIESFSPSNPGSPVRVEVGKTVPLSVTFTNTGNRTGSFFVRAIVKDSANMPLPIPGKTVTVGAGRQDTVTWDLLVPAPGTYTVQFILGKDATTTLAQAPREPAPVIVGVPAVVSTKFKAGDRVRVASPVRVRTGPGTDNREVTHVNYPGAAPVGAQGKVIGGPEKAGEWVWWRVEFDAGYTGWCIEEPLTKVTGG